MPASLYVCTTCQRERAGDDPDQLAGGARLHRELCAALGDDADIQVKETTCLMACDQGCNVHLRAAERITYVIGRFEPSAEAAADIAAYTRLYAQSATGQVPYRQWPAGIKGHFVSRTPPFASE